MDYKVTNCTYIIQFGKNKHRECREVNHKCKSRHHKQRARDEIDRIVREANPIIESFFKLKVTPE